MYNATEWALSVKEAIADAMLKYCTSEWLGSAVQEILSDMP